MGLAWDGTKCGENKASSFVIALKNQVFSYYKPLVLVKLLLS